MSYQSRFEEESKSLLLISGYLFDTDCLLCRLPKEVLSLFVAWEQHERRVLTRSHYKICYILRMPPGTAGPPPPWTVTLTNYEPTAFSPDLVGAASTVLKFLHVTRGLPGFERSKDIDRIRGLLREYFFFLCTQNDHPEVALVPSLEIQALWFTHMLQSCPYEIFILRHLPNVWNFSHPATSGDWTPNVPAEKVSLAKRWAEETFPEETRDVDLQGWLKPLWDNFCEGITPEMVIEDRDWILEFRKFTWGADTSSRAFLEKCHLGYQKFLYLKSVRSYLMESFSFAPCPSIDLMWHTHLLHPRDYLTDTRQLLGHVPKHKLVDLEKRTRVWMGEREEEEEILWKESFRGESMFEYATV
jgi:hypothetical protein